MSQCQCQFFIRSLNISISKIRSFWQNPPIPTKTTSMQLFFFLKLKIHFRCNIWGCRRLLKLVLQPMENWMEHMCWMPRGRFYRKWTFHSLFISILVNTALGLILFNTLHMLIKMYTIYYKPYIIWKCLHEYIFFITWLA